MTWFKDLTSFDEVSPSQVRENIHVDGEWLKSRVNGARYRCGRLGTPSLAELRIRAAACDFPRQRNSLREVVANVQNLHTDEANSGALFQVASQFNLLEMISPHVTPEHGVGIYERDRTQGPACAIAAGAGTIYRNYFVPVNGGVGQTQDNQIDTLADVAELLGNSDRQLWEMKNGYALPSETGLKAISDRLLSTDELQRDSIRERLNIGVQWDTQVTLKGCTHLVTQAYCSALPVAYCRHSTDLWEPFARLILEAAYEATMCAAVVNAAKTGNRRVYLTLLGGGAFGNETSWIIDAISRALQIQQDAGLDVFIVSFASPSESIRQLIQQHAQ